ncbi:MAG: aminotransferase class III-fold pyridoxal phosphate-dependent enzyme [Actinomycetota bacterium]
MSTTFLHPFSAPTKDDFVRIVRGEGALIWDDRGTEYVDAMSALWFANLGYGRREVVEAIAAQAGQLHAYHCFDPFTNGPADDLAARIAGLAPVDDARVFFTGSGSEAVDTAIKLTRAAHQLAGQPHRQIVVSRSSGYHGTNLGGTSAQGIPLNQAGWGDLAPHFVSVPGDDIEAMSVLFAERGDEIAAVISEPVQGAGGVLPPPDGYWPALRRLCDDHGAHLIADEVICGFGRLGTWFGIERYGVRPDLITFAKAVTSGYVPLGGVVVGAAVRGPLEAAPDHVLRTGYTYSGHATACAAAAACLDVTESDGLLARSDEAGARLGAGLAALVEDGLYAGVRGEGFVWALATHDDQPPAEVRNRALAGGVVIRPLVGALAFCPPLVTTDAQIDRIVDTAAAAARA